MIGLILLQCLAVIRQSAPSGDLHLPGWYHHTFITACSPSNSKTQEMPNYAVMCFHRWDRWWWWSCIRLQPYRGRDAASSPCCLFCDTTWTVSTVGQHHRHKDVKESADVLLQIRPGTEAVLCPQVCCWCCCCQSSELSVFPSSHHALLPVWFVLRMLSSVKDWLTL